MLEPRAKGPTNGEEGCRHARENPGPGVNQIVIYISGVVCIYLMSFRVQRGDERRRWYSGKSRPASPDKQEHEGSAEKADVLVVNIVKSGIILGQEVKIQWSRSVVSSFITERQPAYKLCYRCGAITSKVNDDYELSHVLYYRDLERLGLVGVQ